MNISKYLEGKGINVSKIKIVQIDNLYSLKNIIEPETADFIYDYNLINKTKFHRILIKEWFYSCRVNGYIIIDMKENKMLNFKKLVSECNLLLENKIKIIVLVIKDLRIEYKVNPLGLETPSPRISWKIEVEKNNLIQIGRAHV